MLKEQFHELDLAFDGKNVYIGLNKCYSGFLIYLDIPSNLKGLQPSKHEISLLSFSPQNIKFLPFFYF